MAQQVQDQIARSKEELGRIRKRGATGINFSSIGDSVTSDLSQVVYKSRHYMAQQGRCGNFSPILSGWGELGSDNGWCVLVSGNPSGTINGDAAFINWRRSTGGSIVGCRYGKFSTDLGASHTCSGFSFRKYYVPVLNDFRSTTETVYSYEISTPKGNLAVANLISGFTMVHSFECYKATDGPVPIDIGCADSFGIYISGHLKYSSGNQTPNFLTRFDLGIPAGRWTRVDFVHYVPPGRNGYLSIGGDVTDYLDGWRVPYLPSGVAAWYGTFARRDAGEGPARWSYLHAQIGIPKPDIIALGEHEVEAIDIDWKAASVFNGWRRITIPVGTRDSTVSGVWRVPNAQYVEVRARAVSHYGDTGPWHTVSGLTSAAGNVKQGVAPDYELIMTRGIGKLEFEVTNTRPWDEVILLSGMADNHYIADTTLNASATPGDMMITTFGTLPATVSGHLIAIGSSTTPAYQNAGETHLITSVVGLEVGLDSPITVSRAPGDKLYVYHIAKHSVANKLSLPMEDTDTWYFNAVIMNYNGAISNMMSGATSWPRGHITVTATEGIFGDQTTISKNFVQNGGFERPYYAEMLYIAGRPLWQTPLDWWVPCVSGADASTPVLRLWDKFPNEGRVHLYQAGYTYGDGNTAKYWGAHTGVYQDIYGLGWERNYTLKYKIAAGSDASFDYVSRSGMLNCRWLLYEFSRDEIIGRDFQYGDYPPSAVQIGSGIFSKTVRAESIVGFPYPESTLTYADGDLVEDIDIGSGSDDTYPMVRLEFYVSETISGYLTDLNTRPIWGPAVFLDQVSLTRLTRKEAEFDTTTRGISFEWETIRTNQNSNTIDGDHLHIDNDAGFLVRRTVGNAVPFNSRNLSSLAQYTLSGFLDHPRLVWYHPLAVSNGDATGSNYSSNNYLLNGYLRVPSGRALMFDIIPKRTFISNSNSEITIGGYPVGHFVPSGGSYFTGLGWWDPGQHGLSQVLDIEYLELAPDPGVKRISQYPLVARWGDIEVQYLDLRAVTFATIPGATYNPGTAWPIYWHVCDVKIYESSANFIASGIDGAGTNIGASQQVGLAKFTEDSGSIFRGG